MLEAQLAAGDELVTEGFVPVEAEDAGGDGVWVLGVYQEGGVAGDLGHG